MDAELPFAGLRADAETLRGIVAGFDDLERLWDEARPLTGARARGYFTPEEDDRARQLVLAYRNYRIGLWDIISRCLGHEQIADPRLRLVTFMVGYAAGLTLYSRSLKVVVAYEHEPLVRAKLNEAEPRFGLEAGFFDEVLRNHTSFGNYRLLRRSRTTWWRQRRQVRILGLEGDPHWDWLARRIGADRMAVDRLFARVMGLRLRHDWRFFLRSLVRPVADRTRRIQEALGAGFAHVPLGTGYRPGIGPELLGGLRPRLRVGDILLMRGDGRLTAALLPGFWTHAAVYIGGPAELEALGVAGDRRVAGHLAGLPADGGSCGHLIEGVAPRSRVHPVDGAVEADHLVVLRPRLSEAERREAVAVAFSHLGKAYDFEFDFNTADRLVCTELVFRSFHGRGPVEFPLVKRLGRYTLTGDDIVARALDGQGLDVLEAVLRTDATGSRRLGDPERLPKLRAIRRGWRPGIVR